MVNINEYDIFIFDCDGVILESNKLKSNAFAEALSNQPSNLVTEFIINKTFEINNNKKFLWHNN